MRGQPLAHGAAFTGKLLVEGLSLAEVARAQRLVVAAAALDLVARVEGAALSGLVAVELGVVEVAGVSRGLTARDVGAVEAFAAADEVTTI